MGSIPAVVGKRLTSTVPKFKKILEKAKERDVNESDTVTIITDMLEEIFGFDKYSEITREYSIQGTYCDLAIKTDKKIEYLIEVKAIGLELNDKHLKQAVNYASREGIKWVVLTNGLKWEMHRVSLDDKVQNERIFHFDFSEINPRQKDDQDLLFLLCKRGVQKDLIDDYYEYRQSVNRYTIGALLLTDSVTNIVRRELRKLKPGTKVDIDEIQNLIKSEVLKREILESDAGSEANKQVTKFMKKQERAKAKSKAANAGEDDVPEPE
ncbi:MAG: type I restriction enzyme HsdR N-terminal domain-containing protein [Proteobacteria bacterium]|nr:type I restriction enzyme HsdR N-terminal domain-containing protein [Pseudomonadota bacterium]